MNQSHLLKCTVCTFLLMSILTGCVVIPKDDAEVHTPLLGLEWYSDTETVKKHMNADLTDEYEETSLTGQVQTLLEYTGVPLYEQECNVTLCLTNMGLIGINYHNNTLSYSEWVSKLTDELGTPTSDNDITFTTTWENPELEGVTSVMIFQWDEDVQISFFTDDTDSQMESSI